MNRILLLSLGAAVILCLGCAEERPLEPPPVTKLPAMSVLENPIVAISESYRAAESVTVHPSEYTIAIPESVLAAIRFDDIHLTYTTPDGCGSDVFVRQPESGGWVEVARKETPGACLLVVSHYSWLLSILDPRPVQSFIDPHGAVRLKGDHLGRPVIRVIRYHDNYEFLTISRLATSATIASDGRSVWVCCHTSADNNPIRGDSVLVMDLAGQRIRSFFLPGNYTQAMAWGDGDLWVLDGIQPMVFSRMDGEGILSPAFTLPRHHDAIAPAMTWANGRLWIAERDATRLIGIDLQRSVDSGHAVVDREIVLPFRWSWASSLAWDGEYLYLLASGLYKIQMSGEIVDTLRLPVYAGSIAWDGESMWILHWGPREAITYSILLSRFTLP